MENQGLAATRRCDCREQRRKTTFGRFLADPPYVEIQASALSALVLSLSVAW
jgi:hypothetical protein